MRAATLFSGIGAPEQARPDWQWLWHAEIEPFPAAVLATRHPGSVNLGDVSADDFAERAERVGRPDVLIFGSPCQSFSVAGKRLGLSDPRGNLALVALALVGRLRPRWFVFENVPGLLSSEGGRDFQAFLGAVAECGYSGSWRVLDARYWGLAQRRERVFFVGSLGDWRGPAAVLSLAEGLRGYPETRREAGQNIAATLTRGAESSGRGGYAGRRREDDVNLFAAPYAAPLTSNPYGDHESRESLLVSMRLNAHPSRRMDAESETLIAHTLRADGFDASEDGTGRGTPLVPVAFMDTESHSSGNNIDIAPTMRTGDCAKISVAHAFNWQSGGDCRGLELRDTAMALQRQQVPAVAFNLRGRDGGSMPEMADLASVRAASGGSSRSYVANTGVRRLSVIECARLQGFPDTYAHIITKRWRKISAEEARYLASHGLPVEQRAEHRGGRWYTPVPADGPMYKAYGNSMAVPVLRWLLTRIEAHEAALRAAA